MIHPGACRFLEELPRRVAGRRWALLCHGASVDTTGRFLLEALGKDTSLRPSMLLAPEHGLFGEAPYMVAVENQRDPWWGIPIRSLYGHDVRSLAPQPEDLAGLDLLVVDLQDVGARYYTYLATMAMTLDVCAEVGVPVLILDRPNPLGGEEIEGNLPLPDLKSFVSWLPLPNRHGLTPGEVARMHLRLQGLSLELEVLPCEGWRRGMLWPETGLPWVPPSPNMPNWETALVYPGMCLLEGTNLSEGCGTPLPFLLFGAPYIEDPRPLAGRLNDFSLPGITFRPIWFTPNQDKHAGRRCGGCHLVLRDPSVLQPLAVGMAVLHGVSTLFPENFALRTDPYEFVTDRLAMDLLLGDEDLRRRLFSSSEPWPIWRELQDQARQFRLDRVPYLLYPS